jgi:hypothetical protein
VLANILTPVLRELRDSLCERARGGGLLVISGFKVADREELLRSYQSRGLRCGPRWNAAGGAPRCSPALPNPRPPRLEDPNLRRTSLEGSVCPAKESEIVSMPSRVTLVLAGAVGLLLAAGFYFQSQLALALWPLPASRLSNIFIASILCAAAAPVIWIGLSGERAALAGGGLNFAVTYGGIALFYFRRSDAPSLARLGAASGVVAAICLLIFAVNHSRPFRESGPTPPLVRGSFALFSVILALVGGSLVLRRPHVFPWPISPETSVIYGWIFLGAMCYFVYALRRPRWGNARGQLLGFLAYDLVLIGPYLALLRTVKPDLRLNLIVYIAVIAYSGLLAIYFLFLDPRTRFVRARAEVSYSG